jgi:D-glycero-D-manno-heptose 1,7-bisphosphate phosphatase
MGIGSMRDAMRRAVFLDRDGVLNRAIIRNDRPYPPATLAELEIPANVPEALRELKAAGFLLLGVTNQPDVARGVLRRVVVEAINAALLIALPLHEILVCYHDDWHGCQCRKPLPGLLLQAAAKYTIDLSASFMVGDRWRDIEAGRRAGCRTVLIEQGYLEAESSPPDQPVRSLPDGVAWILSQSKSAEGTS